MLRRSPLRRSTKPRGRNTARRASEFLRAYGSASRVAWVKSLPCINCSALPSDNAHTETGGMGMKAGYETIVPLCRRCHRAYDEHRTPFMSEWARNFVKREAARTARAWQEHSIGSLHTTDPLCVTCGASFRETGDQCASCAYVDPDPPRDAA